MARARRFLPLGIAAVVAILLIALAPRVALLLLVIMGPPAAAIALLILGARREQTLWPWLMGAALALVPACYMGFVSVCSHLAGDCPTGHTLTNSHRALVAVGLILVGAIALAVRRLAATRWVFVACAALAEIWMFLRLHDQHENTGAYIMVLALLGAVTYEVLRHVRADRPSV